MAKAMICDVCKKVVDHCESLTTKILIEDGYNIVDNRPEFYEWDLCSDCTEKLKKWLRVQKKEAKEDG